jgi:hypothetical protein
MMEAGSYRSHATLSVAAAGCALGRSTTLPMDLVGRAEAEMVDLAAARERRPDLSQLVTKGTPAIDFGAARKKIEEGNDFPHVIEALAEAEAAVRKALTEMAGKQSAMANAVHEYLRKKDEELQMLWWLVGERSWDLDCAFDAIPSDAQPLVLAKEMADHTEVLPGPPSVKGLLSRAGLRGRKKLAITAAVNAAPNEWLEGVLDEEEYSPVVTPIHFALKRRQETGTGPDWIANWSSVTGIAAKHEMTCLMLGLLFYRERLLATFG